MYIYICKVSRLNAILYNLICICAKLKSQDGCPKYGIIIAWSRFCSQIGELARHLRTAATSSAASRAKPGQYGSTHKKRPIHTARRVKETTRTHTNSSPVNPRKELGLSQDGGLEESHFQDIRNPSQPERELTLFQVHGWKTKNSNESLHPLMPAW